MMNKYLSVAGLFLLSACAILPGPDSVPEQRVRMVVDATLETPAMHIDLRLLRMGIYGQKADQVYFARISGLNGSRCMPRDKRVGSVNTHISTAGSLGFAPGIGVQGATALVGDDITCAIGDNDAPVWRPILYGASRVDANGRATLSGVPTGIYTAVAARFKTAKGDKGTTYVMYFPQRMVTRTEVAVQPGEVWNMGSFGIQDSVDDHFDVVQARYQRAISGLGMSGVGKVLADMISALFKEEPGVPVFHRPGQLVKWAVPGEGSGR